MASDAQNIRDIGNYVTTAQAVGLNHAQRIDSNGDIDALYIDGHWVSVDSIEFADYASEQTYAYIPGVDC